MGSCMSCKAGREVYAYTTSPAVHTYPHLFSMDNRSFLTTNKNDAKLFTKRDLPYTRGQATLFGFKRRPATAPIATSTPLIDNIVANNDEKSVAQEEPESINTVPTGRTSPRLPRPKRDIDGNSTIKTNRFGFRGPPTVSITNKVGDSSANNNIVVASHLISNNNPETTAPNNVNKVRNRSSDRGSVSSLPMPKESNINVPNVIDNNKAKKSFIPQPASQKPLQASRFTLQTSHLPKPQYPVRLIATETEAQKPTKVTKTAYNTRKSYQGSGEDSSSKDSSVNGDSGFGSHQSNTVGYGETDTLHGIEVFDSSPSNGARKNRNVQKARPLEMVIKGMNFEVRDLKDEDSSIADDPNVITEISVINLPNSAQKTFKKLEYKPVPARQQILQYPRQFPAKNIGEIRRFQYQDKPISDQSICFEKDEEEKLQRDPCEKEKTLKNKDSVTPGSTEDEDWGHGEAMAEEFSSSSDDSFLKISSNNAAASKQKYTPCLDTQTPRSVMLKIHDTLFAALAAAAPANLIDDERSPVDSLISSSPPSSTAEELSDDCQKSLVKDSKEKRPDSIDTKQEILHSRNTLSPDSPGTPTNASNSLSLSEGRDFLIDDEIADQPGLTFDDDITGGGHMGADMTSSSAGCNSLLLSMTDNTNTLVDSPPKSVPKQLASVENSPIPLRHQKISRTGSIDTLSPCESLASDDLMLDYEHSESSIVDCTTDSQHDGSLAALHLLDERTLATELESQKDDIVREYSSMLGVTLRDEGLVNSRSPRLLRPRTSSSTPDSPRSVESRPRNVATSRRPSTQTSNSECEDGGVYLDRHTYHSICQDIVNHKTMLLKLMRHLQKDEDNSLMRSEPLNPFDGTTKNGLSYNLDSSDCSSRDGDDSSLSLQDEVADLKRQVEFLQQQLEEKDKSIQVLQAQVTAQQSTPPPPVDASSKTMYNAATQTERIRPVSSGPSLLQSLPAENNVGPLVSSTDQWEKKKRVDSRGISKLPVTKLVKRPNGLLHSVSSTDIGQSNISSKRYSMPTLTASAIPR